MFTFYTFIENKQIQWPPYLVPDDLQAPRHRLGSAWLRVHPSADVWGSPRFHSGLWLWDSRTTACPEVQTQSCCQHRHKGEADVIHIHNTVPQHPKTSTACRRSRCHIQCISYPGPNLLTDLPPQHYSTSPSLRKHTCTMCGTLVVFGHWSKILFHPLPPDPLTLDFSSPFHTLYSRCEIWFVWGGSIKMYFTKLIKNTYNKQYKHVSLPSLRLSVSLFIWLNQTC